jgi:hypothetical protein
MTSGLVYVLGVGSGGVTTMAMPGIPRNSTSIALDPSARFLVSDGPVYELDPISHNPTVHNYTLVTTPLDGAGMPQTSLPESPMFEALLFNDLAVSPSGHLVLGLELYPDSVPDAQAHPLELRAQTSAGQWDVCQTLLVPGAQLVAITP